MASKKLEKPVYAIVQHSAYGYARHFDFKKGLESRQVDKQSEVNQVQRVKGMLFDNYLAAEEYCMKEMYPEGAEGLIPHAPGTFSGVKIGGLVIYIP